MGGKGGKSGTNQSRQTKTPPPCMGKLHDKVPDSFREAWLRSRGAAFFPLPFPFFFFFFFLFLEMRQAELCSSRATAWPNFFPRPGQGDSGTCGNLRNTLGDQGFLNPDWLLPSVTVSVPRWYLAKYHEQDSILHRPTKIAYHAMPNEGSTNYVTIKQ